MRQDKSIPLATHWIGGEPLSENNGREFYSLNPLTDSPVCRVFCGTENLIDQAVDSAASAFESFRHTAVNQRESWLLSAARLLQERADTLVDILIDEIGSPVAKARKEIEIGLKILRASAGATRHVSGKTYPSEVAGRLSYSVRNPLGVIAGLTPFNVPLIKMLKHCAMPLATGNTVVLLPSEETPLLASQVGKLLTDAGLPRGAVNIVLGSGAEIGDALIEHPRVAGVGFTGSSRVGSHVAELCGRHRKRVTLELGGKNPLVVLRNANLDDAVQGSVVGAFLYQGQICMAASRIIVQRPILEQFVERFLAATGKIRQGDLRDPGVMIGPLINQRQRDRVQEHLDDAISKGAKVLCGNSWNGSILSPTVLTDVQSGMIIHDEETFGPVTTIHPVDSESEALELANATRFGLSAAVYTNSLDSAIRFSRDLRAGMVHINDTTIQDEPHVPFGGVANSGFGREGTEAAIDELTEWKWVTVRSSIPGRS